MGSLFELCSAGLKDGRDFRHRQRLAEFPEPRQRFQSVLDPLARHRPGEKASSNEISRKLVDRHSATPRLEFESAVFLFVKIEVDPHYHILEHRSGGAPAGDFTPSGDARGA